MDNKTKFRRQYSIGRYIVDFYCHELKLIIELDGDIHYYTYEKDKVREYYLRKQGYRIIRYTNEQVKHNTRGVLYNIIENINKLKLTNDPSQPPLVGEEKINLCKRN